MNRQETITLTGEKETLLIPLYGRARADRYGLPADALAQDILNRIDYDFSRLRISKKLQMFMSLRSLLMDRFAAEFLAAHPGCRVLHLGCGPLQRRARGTSDFRVCGQSAGEIKEPAPFLGRAPVCVVRRFDYLVGTTEVP